MFQVLPAAAEKRSQGECGWKDGVYTNPKLFHLLGSVMNRRDRILAESTLSKLPSDQGSQYSYPNSHRFNLSGQVDSTAGCNCDQSIVRPLDLRCRWLKPYHLLPSMLTRYIPPQSAACQCLIFSRTFLPTADLSSHNGLLLPTENARPQAVQKPLSPS
jgi:hypothetical protein